MLLGDAPRSPKSREELGEGKLTPRRSLASFLLPIFASYKALKTSDPAQLTPWLMYWVVFACALLVESWTEWVLYWYATPPPLSPSLNFLPCRPSPFRGTLSNLNVY